MTSAYPMSDEVLAEKVRALAAELGAIPSQRQVMRACSVGAPRAQSALAALRAEGFNPAPAPALTVVPDAPQAATETRADLVEERPEDATPGESEGAATGTVRGVSEGAQIRGESLVSDPAGAPTPERVRRDWITDVGVLVVGLAAAVLTFTTLRDLAQAVGITGEVFGLRLSWLLPVTIDAAGIVAARVWLRGQAGQDAVVFAQVLTLVCIALSVCGNAGQHLMESQHLAPDWWVVVLVTSVPPAALGAVVHLGHLIHRQEDTR